MPYREMVYTGPVDAFFDHRYGKLPYRSLEFQHETHNQSVFQDAPVVNYPNEQPYTRVTEFKYLTGQKHEDKCRLRISKSGGRSILPDSAKRKCRTLR